MLDKNIYPRLHSSKTYITKKKKKMLSHTNTLFDTTCCIFMVDGCKAKQ